MKIIAFAIVTLTVVTFAIVAAAVSFVTRRAAAAVNTLIGRHSGGGEDRSTRQGLWARLRTCSCPWQS